MPGSDPPRRGGRSSFEASKRETLPKNRLFRGARKCHRRRVSADDSLPVTLLKSVIGLGESDHQRRDVWTNHRADLPNIHWRVSSKESQSATGRTAQKLIADLRNSGTQPPRSSSRQAGKLSTYRKTRV
jgi:hypothetical protein